LTAEARLARGEEELAALQAQLQRALDDIAAAEASATTAEEQEAASQREATVASAATPALEQEYLLRKQTAALLTVRRLFCGRAFVSLTPVPAARRAAARWMRASRS
jgi:hypothetical protein